MIRWYTLKKDQVCALFLHLIQQWPHRLPHWMMRIPRLQLGVQNFAHGRVSGLVHVKVLNLAQCAWTCEAGPRSTDIAPHGGQ